MIRNVKLNQGEYVSTEIIPATLSENSDVLKYLNP